MNRKRRVTSDPRTRMRARSAVARAIRRGDLLPAWMLPCDVCGTSSIELDPGNRALGVIDYHHEDYADPLAVVPMCRSCHMKAHWADGYTEAAPQALDAAPW